MELIHDNYIRGALEKGNNGGETFMVGGTGIEAI